MSDAHDPRRGEQSLAGNGALLVREIALANRIQRGLESLYRLERAADVDAFMTEAAADEREALFVRESDGYLELSLRVPRLGANAIDVDDGRTLDPVLQIIEGVSHFVYLADRAGQEREATQLELELQAEVDKYVILASSLDSFRSPFDERMSRRLRRRLYQHITFVHEAASEEGERYRVANDYAQRFTGRLEREYVARGRFGELRDELRRFFHLGQENKLRAA